MKYSIELVRLIAVILITFTHTRNNFEEGINHFIFSELPTFGTAILSVISGYLYYKISRKHKGLFFRKIKSLAVPYLIANGSVLLAVLIFYYILGYNPLNRLTYDFSIIYEGLFALTGPPINPPTYFIRDIFIIFCIISLFTEKEFKTLLIIVPFFLFGVLVLRMDITFLFLCGLLYGRYDKNINPYTLISVMFFATIFVGIYFYEFLKFPFSIFVFLLFINLNFKFYNTGRFSYLLHLYHSPIMVIAYPILESYVKIPIINVLAQIGIALIITFILFLLTRRYQYLKILSGGR